MTDPKYGIALAFATLFMIILFIASVSMFNIEKGKESVCIAEVRGLNLYNDHARSDILNLSSEINTTFANLADMNRNVTNQTETNAKYQNITRQNHLDIDNFHDAIAKARLMRIISFIGGAASLVTNGYGSFWALTNKAVYDNLTNYYNAQLKEKEYATNNITFLKTAIAKTKKSLVECIIDDEVSYSLNYYVYYYYDIYDMNYDGFTKEAFRYWTKDRAKTITKIKVENTTFGVALKKPWKFDTETADYDIDAVSYTSLDFSPKKIKPNVRPYFAFNDSNFLQFGTSEILIDDNKLTRAVADIGFDCNVANKHTFYYYNSTFNISYIGVAPIEIY